jgi:hypothetical protein
MNIKPIQGTSNVDIDNLIELEFIFGAETNIDEEVSSLKLANLGEDLPKWKFVMVAMLKVEIPRLISAMGILVIKRLLVSITYHLLLKWDEANGIS